MPAVSSCSSAAWNVGAPPEIAVHVPTFNRPRFLPMLVERLARQDLAAERFEVVIVDNGSDDETWQVLQELVAASTLRLLALRLPRNRGPAGARNAAVAASRAPVVAFTDDDCLPAPGWLSGLLRGTASGLDVVQGRTEPDPHGTGEGAWARTIRIVGSSPLFETCNIAYRREVFDRAGGFDEDHAVSSRPGGRAFGEDVLLGAAALADGAWHGYEPDALVHHRYLPASYVDHVREMRNLAGFPALVRLSPPLAAALWHRWFLTRETAAFDLAAAGVLVAAVGRRPSALLALVPWVSLKWRRIGEHGGRNPLVRLAQFAVADAVGALSLLEGSARHRRLVL